MTPSTNNSNQQQTNSSTSSTPRIRSSTMDRVFRSSLSSSLPILFRTLPASNRRRSNRNRRSLLVSTESQTDSSVLRSSAPQQPPGDDAPRRRAPRRTREKRRRRRGSPAATGGLIATQPLQQHLQQALQLTIVPPTHDDVSVAAVATQQADSPGSEGLPDILNAHLPPPYSTLPHNTERVVSMGPMPVSSSGLLLATATTDTPADANTSSTTVNYSLPLPGRRSRGSLYANEEGSKSCCGVSVNQTISIRWFILMIAFVGICCAVVGTVLGAMRASGREHLTVSLLMIGVGIVLITVSGIAWRLTAHDSPSCRAMLGFTPSLSSPVSGDSAECSTESGRRFMSRIPPVYGRPHHPYAAMLYSDFQYRPPPPSYQASMQDYRLRLLVLDRERVPCPTEGSSVTNRGPSTVPAPPESPPPTYRSQNNTLIRPTVIHRETEISRPPSYRSGVNSASTRPVAPDQPSSLSTVASVHVRSSSESKPLFSTATSLGNNLCKDRVSVLHEANRQATGSECEITTAATPVVSRHLSGAPAAQSLQVLAQL